MRAFFDPSQQLHDPQFFLVRGQLQASAEQPERAERLQAGLSAVGLQTCLPEVDSRVVRSDVHSPEYLKFLQSAHVRWMELPGTSSEVVPNIHPQRYSLGYPSSIVGQAGWHMADTACPIGSATWQAACRSADCAVSAAAAALQGDNCSYALCRPPGHHAFADMAGGFCFLNNAALAASYCLRSVRRVAILDIDVHHGNGTQGIFYRRAEVLTVSIHADPAEFYPFHWGYAHERGELAGDGYNLNLPLPLMTADAGWLESIDFAAEHIGAYQPDVLVVALGLDASEADPLRGLGVTTAGFAEAAHRIRAMRLPTVLVQEGGYLSELLGQNLAAFLEGFV